MPEDQVAKRGTTVQLECRVKHDPSLKLTVSWLKDDEPLYIGNRFLLLPPLFLLLLWGGFFSLALGDAMKNTGNLCHVCHLGTAEEGVTASATPSTSGETPLPLQLPPLPRQGSASLSSSSLPLLLSFPLLSVFTSLPLFPHFFSCPPPFILILSLPPFHSQDSLPILSALPAVLLFSSRGQGWPSRLSPLWLMGFSALNAPGTVYQAHACPIHPSSQIRI